MFLDQTKIHVVSGRGGDGLICFRREKYVPFGGPDGGNGGNGGDVVFRVNEQYSTLLDMGNQRKYKAKNGQPGMTQKRTGKSGETVYVDVPKGTLIKNEEGEILADLTKEGQTWLGAQGGRGGGGNPNYASSKNQTPHKASEGKPGEEFVYQIELKLMADVGLVGFPNAGKSSLVNKISSAQPKVGDYPFTTLEPILGIVQLNYRSFVIADIPGLIEGAADGRGLGHTFLKHIERTQTLLYIIDGFESDAWEKFEILKKELLNFHPKLAEKTFLVALNKVDLGVEENVKIFKENGINPHVISAVTGEGTLDLVKALEKQLPEIEKSTAKRESSW